MPALAKDGLVANTSDLWTNDYSKECLQNLICFIVEDFKIDTITLSCKEFEAEKKTGEEILKFLQSIFNEYGLTEQEFKGAWFTTICGANLLSALKDCYSIECCAHRLNTVLKYSWKKIENAFIEVKNFYEFCSELVKYFKKSGLNSQIDYTLKAHCETRWNSVYLCLESIERNYDSINEKLKDNKAQHTVIPHWSAPRHSPFFAADSRNIYKCAKYWFLMSRISRNKKKNYYICI